MKNWRKKIEMRFTVEPNRFDLPPNASRSVKFYLNADEATNIEEEFIVEGCSMRCPMRETIWESKLLANVIRPILFFSRSDLSFKCRFGGETNKTGKLEAA